jgi:hypothetical protein
MFESCAEALVAAVRNAAVKTAAAIDVNRFILTSCFRVKVFRSRTQVAARPMR